MVKDRARDLMQSTQSPTSHSDAPSFLASLSSTEIIRQGCKQLQAYRPPAPGEKSRVRFLTGLG